MARFVTWNVWNGGIDPDGSEKRRHDQIEVLAQLDPQPTILAIQEARGWRHNRFRRLYELANALGMALAMDPVKSRLGDGENYTALLYRPGPATVLGADPSFGAGVFHHGLLAAHMDVEGVDTMVCATHLSYVDGDERLREVRWLTDNAGTFPGRPDNAVLLMDGNVDRLDGPEPNWDTDVPANMHARYRLVLPEGTFDGSDRRAMGVLLKAGWKDPQDQLGTSRAATVGFKYANEPTPQHFDHILIAGKQIRPRSYTTLATAEVDRVSDHRAVVLDTA
ncbi:endonuclease/exonuclease/phosphatase family protein [Streptomyces sp. x-80]|uniref:endonuclease/exonuclease/phosphatase family protein n=1 Tax=Streptomyces sp. x-80 TaxID=2789282 RepID=UPI0039810770